MPEAHLRKWAVHYFWIEEFNDPHEKYVVILQQRPTSFLGAFINSKLAHLLEQPKMKPCYTVLTKDKHDFLTHDSFFSVDDKNILDFDLTRVSPATLVGQIHADCQTPIIECVQRCPILRPAMMREILED